MGHCLSRVWSPEGVTGRLKELCANPQVENILLRPHPEDRAQLRDLLIDPRITVVTDTTVAGFAEACDLVIVPGSGIAVELLQSGTPTIYARGLDRLGPDPHGLVAMGLLPDVTACEFTTLTPAISDWFGEDWKRVLAQFGPDQDPVSYTHLTLPTNREV